jgi:hypothetical protein
VKIGEERRDVEAIGIDSNLNMPFSFLFSSPFATPRTSYQGLSCHHVWICNGTGILHHARGKDDGDAKLSQLWSGVGASFLPVGLGLA